jgi:predicted nucleic-acid-binding protein
VIIYIQVVVFVDNLEKFITDLHDIVTEATDQYVDRLCGFVDDYIDYANDTVGVSLGPLLRAMSVRLSTD